MKKSQADRLLDLLRDGVEHSTIEILERVYGGGHLGIARIGARIHDLKGRGFEIVSRRDEQRPTIWLYQLVSAPKKQIVEYMPVMQDGRQIAVRPVTRTI